ncbi:hypothetical protein RhiLY_05931 [Ceratobasidium sp. AG-Ba]|nr:hypothetical protein RhiLY_05931 [Ceratobasidium sp. AG-Ba]
MATTALIRSWTFGFPVFSIAVSPRGTGVAVSTGLSIVIWDMITCKTLLGPLQGHTRSVRSLAFSSDGSRIVSGSFDETLRVWDAETGNQIIGPLRGHTDPVNSVTFLRNGKLLVSGSDDGSIRIWNAHTGQSERDPIRGSSAVNSVAVPPDDSKIIGAYSNKDLKAYDIETGAMLFQCIGHELIVASVAVSPDGSRIASASADNTVRIWDPMTGESMDQPLRGYTSSVKSITFSPDGRYIAAGSSDPTIRVWDAKTGEMQAEPLKGHNAAVWAVAFTADSSCLVSGCEDRFLRIWDVHGLFPNEGVLKTMISKEIQEFDPEITSTTTLEEIVSHLSVRGCNDMTGDINMATCTEYPISSGGFGDIYKCRTKRGAEVAIKTIRIQIGSGEQNQKPLKAAAREIYTWSKFQHANVQPLLGLMRFRGQIGMIAKWESNGNLPQYLSLHPQIDRCIMSTKVADGLSYLHQAGVVHGDLKGGNVLVSQDGVPLLADFGTATLQKYTLKFTSTSTKSNISYRWAAPELFQEETCSASADVYALGMTILEAITGEIPWAGKPDHAVMFSATLKKDHSTRPEEHIPTSSEQGETLWSLLRQCWQFEPEKRPSAHQVKNTMEKITRDDLVRR